MCIVTILTEYAETFIIEIHIGGVYLRNSFKIVCANESNPKWNTIITREFPLYSRDNDIRSEFERDFTRVIHSNSYRRLKHKTQVFYSPQNDHICTRIEHVNHVESISYTISHYIGLNEELTRAIAVAHDLGHSPFGHKGEKVLNDICKRDLNSSFWHERNGLYFVDNIELLEDNEGYKQNLDLTYGVRDGIISHCGEIDENIIKPRDEFINLNEYNYPNQFAPYTWEACVVKIADKISYIGRDIEDAVTLGILDEHLDKLYDLLGYTSGTINNTVIINNLIYDLCSNSSPDIGLRFSDAALSLMNKIKKFNYEYIYLSDLLNPSDEYFFVVINRIYDTLKNVFEYEKTFQNLEKLKKFYPNLINGFMDWFNNFSMNTDRKYLKNKVLFNIQNPEDYYFAIIIYIAGMTDKFAIDTYNEIIAF